MHVLFTWEFIQKIREQMSRRDIKGLPEQIAYNLIMAIVPLLVVVVQLATYLSVDTKLIETLIINYAPEELHNLIISLLSTPAPSTATTVFVITTAITFFWLISKGFYGIANAANTTYQVPLMKFAYLERIISFMVVLFMVIFLGLILILFVFGQVILSLFISSLQITVHADFLILFNIIKSLIGFTSYFLFFNLLFFLAPNIK
ncbi:MAG: YhjD/YihY/BrkB family envelope integrity protein, partial [Turicibacter sp.]